jgi:hypothetical protein
MIPPPIARDVDLDTFSDIVGLAESVNWGGPRTGGLVVVFATNTAPTDDQMDQIIARAHTPNAAGEQVLTAALGAIADCRAYLALATPTAAQIRSQVDTLTRIVIALVRRQVS